MEWEDEGILLLARPHGEQEMILSFLTRDHGRHGGLARAARGARGSRFQTGNRMVVRWRARLEDQLGRFECELLENFAAYWLHDALRLSALVSVCALVDQLAPERDRQRALYQHLETMLSQMADGAWAQRAGVADLVRFEMLLLKELGFGLELSACAATGTVEELIYVSPKSARAVSRAAGLAYHDRLLPLPGFLRDPRICPTVADIQAGFALTGYFLKRHATAPGHELPPARARFLAQITANPPDNPSAILPLADGQTDPP